MVRAVALVLGCILVAVSCASPTLRLLRAAYDGDQAGVAAALQTGEVDVNAEAEIHRYIYRRSLAAAIDGGKLEILEMLLNAGADPNQTGTNDASVLAIAVGEHEFDMARLLLARGADPRRVDEDGQTALHYLVEGTLKCREAAEDIGAMGEALLAAGADPNAVDERGRGVLFSALHCRSEPLVRALTRAGVKVDVRDDDGDTPLLLATRIGAHDSMKHLLAAGADPTAKNGARDDACAIAGATHRPGQPNLPMEVLAGAGLACAIAAEAAYAETARTDAARAKAAELAAAAAPPKWEVPEVKAAAPPPPKKTFLDNFLEGARNVDTSAHDRATACPSGGVYCGKSCCGTGMICCVSDGARDRSGGVCMAARSGHGCPWGSHQELR